MSNFKKILDKLNESPKVIDSLDSNQNFLSISKYFKDNKNKFRKTKTENLLKSGDDHNGYYVFLVNNIIEYFVKYKSFSFKNLLEGKVIRQVLVQRFKNSFESAGIPREVFFEYLLPTFGGIITDTEQTDDGKRFWEGALNEALKNPSKYSVYLIDKRKDPRSVIKIENKKHLASLIDAIWGTSDSFKYVLMAIIQN